MLFLSFQMADGRYALDAGLIAEVLPLIEIRPIPHAPPEIAGICDCHGAPLPVIDLSQLFLGRPAAQRLSTRIIVVHYPTAKGDTRLLGLMAEKATEIIRRDPAVFTDCGITLDHAAHLGPIALDPGGLLQRIQLDRLLPPAIRELLFRPKVQS